MRGRIAPVGRSWLLAGFAVTTLLGAFDLALGTDDPLYGTFVVGPFVAMAGASAVGVALVAVYATALALVFGDFDGELLDGAHVTRLIVVVAGSALAVLLTRGREAREHELVESRAASLAGQRTRIALDAGQMGTWEWSRTTNEVVWDEHIEQVFGLAKGGFDGTFEGWARHIHPDDRGRVLAALDAAVAARTPFRFDHRIVWPDGSVHWIEGRGEPVVDEHGRVVGATGVAINIDARRSAEEDRIALLDAERRAREQAEASERALAHLTQLTMALSGAATLDEVAIAMVNRGVEALDAEYGWFGLVDDAHGALVTRAHVGYPPALIEPYATVLLDASLPAVEALRTGRPIFIESAADRRRRFPQFAETVHGAFVVVPITDSGGTRGALSFGFAHPRSFDDGDRRYVAAVVEACAQALRRASLLEAELSSRARLRTLLDASEALSRLDDPDAVLVTTARVAAQRIGRFASIYVRSGDTLRRAAMAHADATIEPVMQALAARGIDASETVRKVAETNEPIVITRPADMLPAPPTLDAEAQRLVAALHPVSELIVPMRVSGRTRGVLLVGDDRRTPLGPRELELTADLARRATSALERAELWQASQERFAAEHRMVEVLQLSIVPERLPDVAGAEFGAVYRPADLSVDVGGDWYDAFTLGEQVMVVVGDVAGHGIEAAALMGRVRNAIRAYAVEDGDPASVLRRADDMLRTLDPHAMVTAVVARYDPATGTLEWARAGHPPPLVCPPDGPAHFLEGCNATPLGTLSMGFLTGRIHLSAGTLLVLYTDGLVERRDHVLDDGLSWLASRATDVRDESPQALCRILADDPFVPRPSADDICVFALRATGTGAGAGGSPR